MPNFPVLLVALFLGLLAIFNPVRADQVSRPNILPASQLQHIFQARQSGLMTEGEGVIIKLLPDDTEGSRHQRFILRLENGLTLLFAHNVDLARRIANPRPGDRIRFRGQYEWNDKGGVIHWTHHDPANRHPAGWLEHQGVRYQ